MPYTLNSDPLGNAPDHLTFSGVVGAVANMLTTFGNSLINLAENLVKAGLKLLSYTAAAISTAVAATEEAFDAFVTWAADFIEATIDALFSPVLDPLADMWSSYVSGINTALTLMLSDYESTGSVLSQ